LAILLT
jgi:hypothetical protein